MQNELALFIENLQQKVEPLARETCIASFDASISGKSDDYQKCSDLQIDLEKIFCDKEAFETLSKIKKCSKIHDTVLLRQLDILYLNFLENQIDERELEILIEKQTKIEEKFNTYRIILNEKQLTDNELEQILLNSKNSQEVKIAWLASKEIGHLVASEILELVKLRNKTANDLGFANYHQMSLLLSEQEPHEIEMIFDELDLLTKDTYASLKEEIDCFLAKNFGVSKEELRPWHYQNRFFQEAPKISKTDFDKFYVEKDLVEITSKFYKSIGLPIEEILEKSDLYEKHGKYQHAYCMDVDKKGDVRVVCNLKSNLYWMNTMLHEFGHAVYDKFMSHEIPYFLREPAHIFTTEAIAMFFGRLANNIYWIKEVVGIDNEINMCDIAMQSHKKLQLEQLVFSRWAQVMYRFEKELYNNPEQDLNKLWWDLVEQYQMIKRPENRNSPDWATKIHIASSPCYYHNYLLGELLASQLYAYVSSILFNGRNISELTFYDCKELGAFLRENIFNKGSLFHWNEMIEKATGEKLTAKYYAKQFVK